MLGRWRDARLTGRVAAPGLAARHDPGQRRHRRDRGRVGRRPSAWSRRRAQGWHASSDVTAFSSHAVTSSVWCGIAAAARRFLS